MHFLWRKYKLNSDKYKFLTNCNRNFVKKLQIVLINLNVICKLLVQIIGFEQFQTLTNKI